ncbi:MAG: hypothetical protein P4M09_20575, partial [Devosia sp.]|nr:hypothetical protein [Devosia sp.]
GSIAASREQNETRFEGERRQKRRQAFDITVEVYAKLQSTELVGWMAESESAILTYSDFLGRPRIRVESG